MPGRRIYKLSSFAIEKQCTSNLNRFLGLLGTKEFARDVPIKYPIPSVAKSHKILDLILDGKLIDILILAC
jgi:hypothetical protein